MENEDERVKSKLARVKRILDRASEMSPELRDIVAKFADYLEVFYALEARRESEKELQYLKERFRKLVEDNPIGMSITSPQGKVVEANPAAFKMFGYDSLEEFTGLPTTSYWYDLHDREKFFELVEQGKVICFEAKGNRKDGSNLFIYVTSVLYPIDGATRLANFFVDITDRKEEEIRGRALAKEPCAESSFSITCELRAGSTH